LSRNEFASDEAYIAYLEAQLVDIHNYLIEVTSPGSEKQSIRKSGWIETLQDVLQVGVPSPLQRRVNAIIKGIERSKAYGGSSRYKQEIVKLQEQNGALRALLKFPTVTKFEGKDAFEEFARGQNALLTPTQCPNSFRVYKQDRTQHMFEGWQGHMIHTKESDEALCDGGQCGLGGFCQSCPKLGHDTTKEPAGYVGQ
jgi:hypothetical protein